MATKEGGELHLLRRITVLDKQCSCPLYDKIITWKTEDRSPGTAAKIISLFNSIAFTFNDFNKLPDGKPSKDSNDRVRRVIFEHTAEQQRKSKSNYSKYSTGLPSLGGRGTTAKASTSASRFMMGPTLQAQSSSELEIFLQTSGSIHVAIFFKPSRYIDDGWEPQLLRDICHDFLQKYEDKLREFAPQFQAMARDQEAARNNYDFMPAFADFEPIIGPTSDFTITSDIANNNNQNARKLDLGRHMLPLSSDLQLTQTPAATPNAVHTPQIPFGISLASSLGDHSTGGGGGGSSSQVPTPSHAEDSMRIQKEQRNQRRALQQVLQPPSAKEFSEPNTPTNAQHRDDELDFSD